MKNKNNALLIEQNAQAAIGQWDEIVRSIIMFADVVWLHSALDISNRIDDASKNHIHNVLEELVENGLIKFYSLESDEDRYKDSASRVITKEEHMELYNSIVENVKDKDRIYVDNLPDPERTSRIVECRNELWRYGIATLLDADISVSYKNRGYKNYMSKEIDKMAINSELTAELFNLFNVPSLAHLRTEDILAIRKNAKKYRKNITELSVKVNNSVNENLGKVVQDEYQEFIGSLNELAQSAAGNKAIKRMTGNTFINVVGLFFPPMAALACGLDYYSYFKDRKKYGFVLFMNSLAHPK